MSKDSTTQCLLFPGIFRKPVVAQFDQREGSSDGGALLLKAADRHYGFMAGLASCLRDDRQAGKVDHSLRELVGQRVFSIACGYPDANDSARLSGDPIHKLLLDRDPIEGRELASQPTLSRFENEVGVKELYRAGEFLAESVIRRHAKRLRHRAYRVTIDLDPTDDPTHGAQQLSFFNGYYDTWCYLPVMGFVSFNDEAEPVSYTHLDVYKRQELGIGRYLIGRCRDCDSFCVVFGRVDAKKDRVVEARKSLEEAGLLRPPCTREEFRALMDGWCCLLYTSRCV